MKVVVGVLRQIIAVGSEVVIDDIKNHTEPDLVRVIDESSQIVWRTIFVVRSEEVDSVVSPAKLAGEAGHRHHLDYSDAELLHMSQLLLGAAVGAFRGKGPDVEFVNNLTAKAESRPLRVRPGEAMMLNDL